MTPLPPPLVDDLRRQRWFAAKDRTVVRVEACDRLPLPGQPETAVELVRVDLADGATETYALVRDAGSLDLLHRPPVARLLLDLVRESASLPTERGGQLLVTRTQALDQAMHGGPGEPRLLGVEQSNTSVRFDDALVLKLYRRLRPGINPELEVSRFFTECTSFRSAPQLAASAEYRAPTGETSALLAVLTYIPNRGDAWAGTLARLGGFLMSGDPTAALEPMERLARVTASMHVALASAPDDPAFAPEQVDRVDVERWTAAAAAEVGRAGDALRTRGAEPGPASPQARVLGLRHLVGSFKIRHHGDFHLGQVLEKPNGDFAIIDFEGEPLKPLALRRARASVLRDVAGMLRSFDYARHAALRQTDAHDSAMAARAETWLHAARSRFLDTYLGAIRREARELLPADGSGVTAALDAFELEKAAYEVLYEINHRPDWLPIPLAAFLGRSAA